MQNAALSRKTHHDLPAVLRWLQRVLLIDTVEVPGSSPVVPTKKPQVTAGFRWSAAGQKYPDRAAQGT